MIGSKEMLVNKIMEKLNRHKDGVFDIKIQVQDDSTDDTTYRFRVMVE